MNIELTQPLPLTIVQCFEILNAKVEHFIELLDHWFRGKKDKSKNCLFMQISQGMRIIANSKIKCTSGMDIPLHHLKPARQAVSVRVIHNSRNVYQSISICNTSPLGRATNCWANSRIFTS
jgi:hypothetical protein